MRKLTLTEYLNQTDPHPMPYVELQEGEFTIGRFYGGYGSKVASLQIKGIDAEYAVKHNGIMIYSTDSDGNPRSRSCFFLPKDFYTSETYYKSL